MAVSDKIKAMLNLKGNKIMELADYFEMSPQAMRNKLNRGSFSAEDLIRISMFLDAELSFRISDNQIITLDKGDLRENIETAEQIRRFKRLDKCLEDIRLDKMYRDEYPTNKSGVMVIPVVSDAEKPNDVSEQEWREYMNWKFKGDR